jgi:lipopolysaccharide transport system permease protein
VGIPPSTKEFKRVIRPRRAWYRVDWARLFHYRDLLFILVRGDFVSRFQQTILGPAWFAIQPIVTTIVFTLVFGRALRTPTDGVPPFAFYLCGMLLWTYFSNVLSAIGSTFTTHASIFGKVYFPRVIMPLSVALSNLMNFGVQLAIFLVVDGIVLHESPAARAIHPDFAVLAILPAVLLQTVAFALGVGLLVAGLSAKYRDLQHTLPLLVQVWMFATPIVYPLSRLSPRAQWVAALNPLTNSVELFRLGFFGVGTATLGHAAASLAATVLALACGFAVFQHVERTVVDTV